MYQESTQGLQVVIPAVAAELDIFSTLTAQLRVTARTPGAAGSFIVLLNNQNASLLGVFDLGIINGFGPVVILNSPPSTTFNQAASALVSGSVLVTAAVVAGDGTETFISPMAGLTAGFPPELLGPAGPPAFIFPPPSWYSGDLAGGTDAESFDTYKGKILRNMLPPPYDRRFQATIGKVLSVIGASDNDIGGLFGVADFLPNEDT
jgi:hypothetical protein